MYVKKNMTLLRCPIEKGLDMLGGKWKSRILCVLAQRGPIPVRTVQTGDDQCDRHRLIGALKELIRDGLAAVRLLRQIADWADGSIPTGLSRGEMPLCLGCDFND